MDTSWDNIAYSDVLRELGGGEGSRNFLFFLVDLFLYPKPFRPSEHLKGQVNVSWLNVVNRICSYLFL